MIEINSDNLKKMFDKLEKENNLEMIEEIILILESKKIYEMTPISVKSDDFIKKSLEAKIISTKDLTGEEKSKITKEYYLKLLKINLENSADEEMWKDEETLMMAIKTNPVLLKDVISQNRLNVEEDIDKIIKLFKESDEVGIRIMSRNIDENCVKHIEKKDPELLMKILIQQYQVYRLLSEEKKKEPKYVKAVLNNDLVNGFYVVKEELKKIKDKDVAIMALEKENDAVNYIYQPYQKILKDNNVKSNYGNFLNIYLLHEEMKKELYKKNNISKQIIKKNKI